MSIENSPIYNYGGKLAKLAGRLSLRVFKFAFKPIMGEKKQRYIPLYLFTLIVLALIIHVELTWGLMSIFQRRMLTRMSRNVFLNRAGLTAIIIIAGLCLFDGWPVLKKAFAEMRAFELWLILPVMALISMYIGYTIFEVRFFFHAMYWGWDAQDYLIIVRRNFIRILIPAALMILILRPWRFASPGVSKLISCITGVIFANYILAFMAYTLIRYATE